MKITYRALLMTGGMLSVAAPALAQPESLLAQLNRKPTAPAFVSHYPYLDNAHEAVQLQHWAGAEAALERSETFLLNSGVRSSAGLVASPYQAVSYVIEARAYVQQRDQVDALLAIDKAISAPNAPEESRSLGVVVVPPPPGTITTVTRQISAVVPVPMVTKALLPGHWQLVGWQYHWVPPDTTYRSVQANEYITGHYEYRGGNWIWIGGHYGTPTS
jgi:hypothetical protein